jgi:hypothetical protein
LFIALAAYCALTATIIVYCLFWGISISLARRKIAKELVDKDVLKSAELILNKLSSRLTVRIVPLVLSDICLFNCICLFWNNPSRYAFLSLALTALIYFITSASLYNYDIKYMLEADHILEHKTGKEAWHKLLYLRHGRFRERVYKINTT